MKARPPLLVLDDGELDDVVALLHELGVEFAHLRGAAIPARLPPPERVLVTTPRRAMVAKDWPRTEPLRIAVVTEDSNTLRAMLRRIGFDLLLRRPVHPVALRLVLVRALYVGDEKRREERIALGTEISFRTGFRRRKALLADLSLRGLRLLGDTALAAGARVTIPLPKEISPAGLTLPCKVVRVSDKRDAEGRYEMGLAFENLSKEKYAQVRAVVKQLSDAAGMEDPRVLGGKARGDAAPPETSDAAASKPAASAGGNGSAAVQPSASLRSLRSLAAPTPTQAQEPGPASAESAAESDRRKHERGSFDHKVARLGSEAEAESVLLGRDLSVGGMRVEYHPNLQIGDVLQLALYASPREEPIVVKARVVQDAGDGLGLSFENVNSEIAARLERLVARLPSIESLQAGERAGLGSVVSRVLSGFGREE